MTPERAMLDATFRVSRGQFPAYQFVMRYVDEAHRLTLDESTLLIRSRHRIYSDQPATDRLTDWFARNTSPRIADPRP